MPDFAGSPDLTDGADPAAAERIARRKRIRFWLMLVVPAAIVIVLLYVYLTGGRYQSTDNAALQTGLVAISPGVTGRVIAIEVSENQRVRKGQVLFRVSSDFYRATATNAEAELAQARAAAVSLQADYREALADVEAARAQSALAAQEAARQKSLLGEGISSRSQYEVALTAARTAGNAIASAGAKAESLRARLSGRTGGSVDDLPEVRRAASQLAIAQDDLGDTVVRAPQDGIVTKVNQIQLGSFVTRGKPAFMLAGTKVWVQANFKESQLRHMRVGQPAVIRLDAFPDHEFRGRIASFSPGTGSSFSVLPPENATGNWVKVVQRVPVQITIDDRPADLPMSAGLSAEVDVDTGYERHLFGPDTPASAAAR